MNSNKNTDLELKRAISLQNTLRKKIVHTPLTKPVTTIGAADVSTEWHGNTLFAGALVFSYPQLECIDQAFVKQESQFPYISGFLSFREIPAINQAMDQLKIMPDVVFVDGQGIMHPRRMGIAAHLVVLRDRPTIGIAKSRLYGVWETPEKVGQATSIYDPKTHDILGVAYKSKARANPILISPGHRITLDEAVALVVSTLGGYRLPLPIRRVHDAVNEFRKKMKSA